MPTLDQIRAADEASRRVARVIQAALARWGELPQLAVVLREGD